MTRTAKYAAPEPGKFRRFLTAMWAFLQAMESTSFDDTHDRIDALERQVRRLTEELRESREPSAGDAHHEKDDRCYY